MATTQVRGGGSRGRGDDHPTPASSSSETSLFSKLVRPEMGFTEFHRRIKEAADNTLGNPEALLNQALISSFIAFSNIPSACHGTGTEQTVSDNKIHPIFQKEKAAP